MNLLLELLYIANYITFFLKNKSKLRITTKLNKKTYKININRILTNKCSNNIISMAHIERQTWIGLFCTAT